MKKLSVLILSLLYTFVAIGGSIFVHECNHETVVKLYNKINHGQCPICLKNTEKKNTKKSCHQKKCSDREIKIDQLDNTIHNSQSLVDITSPAILPIFWISIYPEFIFDIITKNTKDQIVLITDSSPPTYLRNCIFRI